MRNILFKNLTSDENRKQDLCIKETVEKDDFEAMIERRCIYFVRERVYIDDPRNLDELKTLKKTGDVWKKKHFHILRNHDSRTGEDKLACKVAGSFYVIVGHYVFCIAFLHSFKINMAMVSADRKKG